MQNCPTCQGGGTLATTKRVEVKIPAGIAEGKKLRVPGKGVIGSNGQAGDLYVVIRELPHETFRRKGDGLECDVETPYFIAALGGEIKVPTLRGVVTMKIPEGTQSGQAFRLSNQGITKLGGQRGDLMARIKISVPKKLAEGEREALSEIRKLHEVKS